jgi:hypothetical protein
LEPTQSTAEQKPAPIESVPVLPYSIIEGQLDHSDPFWLGRISAAVVVFLFAVIFAFIKDAWLGLRQHAGMDPEGWTYNMTNILSGSSSALLAVGSALLSTRESTPPLRVKMAQTVLPWLAFGAIAAVLANYILASYVSIQENLLSWNTLAAVSAIASLAAAIIAGTILLEICRRLPNKVLEQRIVGAVTAMAAAWIGTLLVSFGPSMNIAWLTPKTGDPLPAVVAIATVAAECFTAVVLLQLLRAINAAAATARVVAVQALRRDMTD